MEEVKKDKSGKIILPKELQKQIMSFFIKTSMPKIDRKKRDELS